MEWGKDTSNYTQNMLLWWKTLKLMYPYHELVTWLIVLAQLSSCSVERVFPKLEHLRLTTGDGVKEDMLEVRLLPQINGDLNEMYNTLVLNYSED